MESEKATLPLIAEQAGKVELLAQLQFLPVGWQYRHCDRLMKLARLASEHDWSYFDIRRHVGLLRNIVVRNSTLGEWMITFVFGESLPEKTVAARRNTGQRSG